MVLCIGPSVNCTMRAMIPLLQLTCWLSCGVHLTVLTSARPLEALDAVQGSQKPVIHTVVPTECNPYQDWQVLGLYWSWKKVGSPGMFTRIACCELQRLKGQQSINPYQLYYTNTNVDPDGIGDNYIAYNKPYGIMSWLQDVNPAGDYFLIVDADMTFHRSVTAEELGVEPGWGAGQHMWYMQELNQFLAQMLLPSQAAAAALSSRRQLRSVTQQLAPAMPKAAADTVDVQQRAHLRPSAAQELLEDLLAATGAAKGQAQGTALQAERQTQKAALPVNRQLQAERGVLQEGTNGAMQEALLADLAAAETILPLADEIGEIYMYTADDIRAIAPLWWNYTRQMRVFHETHAQELPKDTPIERPWIAEMYAIALGAAQAGIHHKTYRSTVMHPPGAAAALNQEGPSMVVTHYAWNAEVPSKDWRWNKHVFKQWSPLTCPPWNLDQEMFEGAWDEQYPYSQGGLFPHPPLPSELTSEASVLVVQDPEHLFEDLVNIEMVAMLNEAFCELHHKPYCPPSEELTRECGKVTRMMQEVSERYQKLANGSDIFCIDTDVPYCAQLRAASDTAATCQQQQQAKDSCRRSCGLCHDKVDSSSLVWYNQAKSPGSTPALTPTPTPAARQVEHAGVSLSPNHTHGQAQVSSSLQDVVHAGGVNFDDQPDSLADELSRPVSDRTQADDLQADTVADAISSEQVQRFADSMLKQPAAAGMADKGTKAYLIPSTMHESHVDVAASPVTVEKHEYTVEQLANSSGDSNLLRATAFSAAPESSSQDQKVSKHMHVVPTTQDNWQNHLSNPFCKSVLCLSALLLMCVLCLLRGKLKRRKVLR